MAALTTKELFDPDTILGLLRRTDPQGVLSIYVGADSGADPGLQGAAIDIKNRLAELERNIAAEGPPARADALRKLLHHAGPDIEALTSPQGSGRGRALFASLGAGETIRFSSQMAFANRVVLDDAPFIHPLLELVDEGRPAGVLLVAHDHARLLEWRLGELQVLDELAPDVVEAPHERSGPVGSSPGGPTQTPKREQRDARDHEQTRRFLDRVAAVAGRLAAEHGWERVMVSGGERLTEPLADALDLPADAAVIREPRALAQLDPASLSATVGQRLHAQHDEQEAQLVSAVRDAALGSGAGALGLSEVVGALNEGRVAHLVYDPDVRYHGSTGADGTLFADDEGSADTTRTPEARLTERLVERALGTGARVTPVEGAASAELADAAGIAALLRW